MYAWILRPLLISDDYVCANVDAFVVVDVGVDAYADGDVEA